MAGIFISYRRQDSQSAAGRLADHLRDHLAQVSIFRDVETIEPGVDFVQAIEKALASCGVMLVVIGPRWLSATDASGRRRLDDPRDYTRLEVVTALRRQGVRVIPVLVEGAEIPAPDDLPEDLAPLSRRNAIEVTDKRWDYDVSQLAATLRKVLGIATPPPVPEPKPSPVPPTLPARAGKSWGRWAALAGAVVLVLAGYLSGIEEQGQIPLPETGTIADYPPEPAPAPPAASKGDAMGNQQHQQTDAIPSTGQPRPIQMGIDISGLWLDDEGGRHQITQQGTRIAVQGMSPDGVVYGMGALQGRTGWVEYTLNGQPLRAALEVSANGNQMRVVVVDAASGAQDVLTMNRVR